MTATQATNKPRMLSVEALRIVAMLMVLGLHVNFLAVDEPTPENVLTVNGVTRSLLQSLCLPAVNTFVMISGWFGIKSTYKGLCNFLWQVFYFVGITSAILVCSGLMPLNHKVLLSCFGLYNGGGWFVAAYIGLYILAPVLNAFIAASGPKTIVRFLIPFFIFEWVWNYTQSVGFIMDGYSTFSFIGLYILARLLNKLHLDFSAKTCLGMFAVCVLVNGALFIACKAANFTAGCSILLSYINPLIIAEASFLIMAFARMKQPRSKFTTRAINWIAPSCFGAYLLHVGTPISLDIYTRIAQYIYTALDGGCVLLIMAGFILSVLITATIVDQPRKLLWNKFLAGLFYAA